MSQFRGEAATMVAASPSDPRRALLQRVAPPQRGPFMNMILGQGPSAGLTEPAAIVAAAKAELDRRIANARRYGDHDGLRKFSELYAVISENREEALALAAWAVEWESLPRAEREKAKAERAEEGRRAWMDTQPPTEKQIAYLRSLGFEGEVRSRLEASQRIDELKRGSP